MTNQLEKFNKHLQEIFLRIKRIPLQKDLHNNLSSTIKTAIQAPIPSSNWVPKNLSTQLKEIKKEIKQIFIELPKIIRQVVAKEKSTVLEVIQNLERLILDLNQGSQKEKEILDDVARLKRLTLTVAKNQARPFALEDGDW